MGVIDSGSFAEQRIGFIEKENPFLVFGQIKNLSRFFSVSPIYLDTTVVRTTL